MSDLLPWGAPFSGWAVELALFVIGLLLMRRALRRRRAPGQRRCPACGYDLSRSPTDICSECGRRLKNERESQLRPRRPWLAVAGLIVAVGLPVFVAQMRLRQGGLAYYTRLYPIYWFSPEKVLERYRSGPYRIQITEDRRRRFKGAQYDDQHVTIRRGRQVLWTWEDWYITGGMSSLAPAALKVPPVADIDQDGTPEFICTSSGGGNGGFSLTHILRLGQTLQDMNPHAKDDLSDNLAFFADLDQDGRLDIVGFDSSFSYLHTSHAGSAYPRVAYRIVNRHLELSAALTAAANPVPTATELAGAAAECKAAGWAPLTGYALRDELFSPLLREMTGLIYAGHSEQAFAFLDNAWPGPAAEKAKFLAEFCQCIEGSPNRAAVYELGYRPPAGLALAMDGGTGGIGPATLPSR